MNFQKLCDQLSSFDDFEINRKDKKHADFLLGGARWPLLGFSQSKKYNCEVEGYFKLEKSIKGKDVLVFDVWPSKNYKLGIVVFMAAIGIASGLLFGLISYYAVNPDIIIALTVAIVAACFFMALGYMYSLVGKNTGLNNQSRLLRHGLSLFARGVDVLHKDESR
jgi:hypothetical protein